MKTAHRITSHIALILATAIIIFYILDIYNPQMDFLTCSFSLGMVVFFAACVILSVCLSLLSPRSCGYEKKRTFLLHLALDIAVLGVFLCVFAYFHHVRPSEQSGLGIVIDRVDTQAQQTDEPEESSVVQEDSQPSESVHKFESLFSSDSSVYLTDTEYRTSDVYISVTERTAGSGSDKVTYFVADIYLRDPTDLTTVFAQGKYGSNIYEDIEQIYSSSDAILAISGDYYSSKSTGVVIRNGTVYRSADTDSDICVLYYDGSVQMLSPQEYSLDEAVAHGAYQAWTFGPSLLNADGSAKSSFNTTSYLLKAHPRCAIGYYEPGHYCFVTVDGRQDNYSVGMTMQQLASLFESLGCASAYNLDGGKSAMMMFNGEIINKPWHNGRDLSDILIISG